VSKTVVNKLIKGQITIVKVDENKTPISGVKFEILDANKKVVDTITTGADGKATSKKLVNGTYYYREIEAPSNVIMDTKEYEFKLTDNTPVITKTVVNKLVKGSIEILKVDENNTPISGVKFEILDSNKNVVYTITTDKNGKATANNLLIGTYYYREVSAPSNVVMDTAEYKFIVTAENQVITKTVVNKLVKGHIEILKVDTDNMPIEGVKFQILDSNKKVIEEITTDKNGKAISKDLGLGTYYYKEVSAPDKYVMDTTEYKFKLTETNNVITKTVVNKMIKGSLKIIKVDENDTPLKGVKFEILDANKKVVDTITTDKDGIAISKELEIGTYYYREISAPENVVMDENEYIFKLNETNDLIVKKIVNKLATGKLQILKLDKKKNTPIEGVKFEILNENEEVIDTIVTNKDGIAISKDLKVGTYFFREIEAPNGYIMDSNVYKFKITKSNQVIEKTIYNEKEELPRTGGFLSTDIIIIIAIAIVSIIAYSIYCLLSVKKGN
ncbi:MAG: SpaA isopeptide-forming pilin-related protein, partial [Clostridia bacterium]|nr:SpaA isopeptide-forming pilin-related protein [Clostridia bacterium]